MSSCVKHDKNLCFLRRTCPVFFIFIMLCLGRMRITYASCCVLAYLGRGRIWTQSPISRGRAILSSRLVLMMRILCSISVLDSLPGWEEVGGVGMEFLWFFVLGYDRGIWMNVCRCCRRRTGGNYQWTPLLRLS